jgi:hypothetical protein
LCDCNIPPPAYISGCNALPFLETWLNSTSPLLNWNLTVLSKETPATFKVFKPKVNAIAFPLLKLPLATVLTLR